MARRGFSPSRTLYTRASTADNDRRYFPSEAPVRNSAEVKSVRPQADVYNMTGDCYLQFGFQESDDAEAWPGAATFTVIGTTTITADGLTGGNNGFETITLTKAFVRFGMVIRNNNAGSPKYECVWVSTRFDTRAC